MNATSQSSPKVCNYRHQAIGASGDDDRLERLAFRLGVISAALTAWLHVKPRTRGLASNLIGYGLKIVSGATAPVLSAMGLAGALVASQRRRPWRSLPGWIGALLGLQYIWRVCSQVQRTAPPQVASPTPGEDHFPAPSRNLRAQPRLRPRLTRDLTFATIPGSHRDLLCDLWEPDHHTERSGLSIIYVHGGAWQSFDKDVMTRPFFRHLTAQGHVVMDIAYRLAGETDMRGMLGDVKRAVTWLKMNHASLGVDPAKVALAGGSAGAHLALLAAYTPNTPGFDPEDTLECDTSACAVVAFYPVADLRTLAIHWSEQAMHPLATALGKASGLFPQQGYLPWSRLARRLFGGPLGTISRELLAFSPVAHVGAHCPPTLILQGLHDHVIVVEDVLALHAALVSAGCPATLVSLPMVEHAFDMLPLRISPPRQAALRAVDRFLAQVA